MIYVSKEVAANAPGHPKLSRSEIWKGLVMKAENALPFVPGMAAILATTTALSALTVALGRRGIRIPI